MNTNKKLIILSLAFLLCITIGGTLAYSTSTQDDTNVFSTSKVDIEQLEYERKNNSLEKFTQKQEIKPAYYVNDEIEFNPTAQQWDDVGVDSENNLYASSVKNVIDKFVFIKNAGKTDAYYRTIIAFECPTGFDYSLIHTNLNQNNKFNWDDIGYISLGEHRYYFISATYQEVLTANEVSIPSLLQVFLDPKTTNDHMDLLGDTFDILVKTQAAQSVDGETSEDVLNKVFGAMTSENIAKWFDLRPKLDVTNYEDLTTALSRITEDYVINVKSDITAEGETVSINEKNIEFFGDNIIIKAGNIGGSYSYRISNNSNVIFNNINIQGGGMSIWPNSNVVINGGGIDINFESTSGRYGFYVELGSTLTINGGKFEINTSSGQNMQRAYIYAGNNSTIYINGGEFGKASSRNGYTTGIKTDGTAAIIITGGTFGFDPTTWVADGYQAVKSGSTWTVVPE